MPRKTPEPKNEHQIFDSFMEFLRSDLWTIPISQFMEQRSLVFEREPADLSVAPNTAECYQGVHAEFTGIVNDLLNAYCQDSGGLTREQLMGSLKAQDKIQGLTQKDRMSLEPIVAAQDFDVFVPMMMRKNIELQLQALKMIEHMKGLVPNSLTLGQEDAEIWDALFEEDESDRLILISVLKQSKAEWEKDQRMQQDWQAQMEAAIRESLMEKSHLEELRRKEQNLLEQALSKVDNTFTFEFKNLSIGEGERNKKENGMAATVKKMVVEPKEVHFEGDEKEGKWGTEEGILLEERPGPSEETTKTLAPAPKEKKKVGRSNSNKVEGGEEEEEAEDAGMRAMGKREANGTKRLSLGQVHAPTRGIGQKATTAKGDLAYRSLLKQREGIPEDSLQSRMHYLREQRDKLLQKKSREREKQLMEAAKRINELRPRTAQTAKGAMEQGAVGSDLDERRKIAAKIKAEVIDKSEAKHSNQQ